MPESNFYLHTSNRTERLTDCLLEGVRHSPLPSLLAEETVMVLNPGVARWLQFDIAKKQGIAAGWSFPFTGKVFQNLLSGFFPELPETGVFDEATARWHIYSILNSPEANAFMDFAEDYCQGANGIRTYPLASKLAALFDEYLVYRPDLIIEWETSPQKHPGWLAKLWRKLSNLMYPGPALPMHIARCWSRLKEATPHKVTGNEWPERLHIFGVSLLAPLYLDCLQAFARYRPVHIYLLQPSDMYWADLRTGRQLKKASQRKQRSRKPTAPTDVSMIESSSLLPSWGHQGQSFLDLLIDRDPHHDDSAFSPPAENTQLNSLQSDLYHIRERGLDNSSNDDFLPGLDDCPDFPAYDGSIQVHATCSKQRECQVLWDYLIDQFHKKPDLRPDDILVMAPDIQEYITQIKVAFESTDSPEKQIPFSIADRSIPASSHMAAALSNLLELPQKRITSLEFIEFLEQPAITKNFDLTPEDLATIETWIRIIGTRWGWSPKHRSYFKSSEKERDTWQEFRRRLQLGIALGGDEPRLAQGQLPFPHLEANYATLAGRLLSLMKVVDSVINLFLQEKSAPNWNLELSSIVRQLFLSNKSDDRELRSLLEPLNTLFPDKLNTQIVGRDAFRAVSNELLRESPKSGFLNGAVTFCSLKPMRSVPAKIICIIGLNTGAFPRSDNRNNFDIIASSPKPGDRNAREEDKQIFLETILSARDALFLSFQDVSPTSDDHLPPSPLLSQLIDYINTSTRDPHSENELLTRHKRQAHDEDYFNESNQLFTYNDFQADVATAFSQAAVKQEFSVKEPVRLHSTHDSSERVHLSELLALLQNPCKFFQQRICGIRQTHEYQKLAESETLTLDGLENYKLHETYLENVLTSSSWSFPDAEILSKQKILPSGFLKTILNEQSIDGLEALRNNFPIIQDIHTATPHDSILKIESVLLSGTYELVNDEAQVLVFAGKLQGKAKRILHAWIYHVFTNLAHGKGIETIALSTQEPDKSYTFSPLEKAQEILNDLVATFEEGLHSPLAHFPGTSFEFAKNMVKDAEKQGVAIDQINSFDHWKKVRVQLRHSDASANTFQSKNEWDNNAEACFGEALTDSESFETLSLQIWQPILEAMSLSK